MQKFRASWNKYNLYNLTRLKPINTAFFTFYQQKWKAKSMSRAYHGEQIREKQWQRMFTPRLNAVVPIEPKYLAEFDGSELAAGRGSGLEKPLSAKDITKLGKKNIPYMHMTYAPIERRLDMAIFRALFASSAKQARQFVTHGKVKVNGKKVGKIIDSGSWITNSSSDAIPRIPFEPRRPFPSRARFGIVRNWSTERYGTEEEGETTSEVFDTSQHHNGQIPDSTARKEGSRASCQSREGRCG